MVPANKVEKIKYFSTLLGLIFIEITRGPFWFDQIGGFTFVLNLNCKASDVEQITKNKIPKFYKEVLESWLVLKENNKNPSNQDVLTNQMMWNNSDVKCKNQILVFK